MDNLILDGAMGTRLMQCGMRPGEVPEVWGMQHPEILEGIHREYIGAGARVIYADTFCANPRKLKNTPHTPEEVIKSNILTAKKAAGDRARVALDVGPLGAMMAPLGDMTFEEAYSSFARMLKAGEEAGADLAVFETMTDLREVRAGVLAAKENTRMEVWVTMTFEKNGRTFAGTDAGAMALTLDRLGADALGVNCSLGPKDLVKVVERIREYTDLPVIVKPNAGLPDPETGAYSLGPEEFAEQMAAYPALGVGILGGCCGTDRDYIRALSALPPAAPRRGKKANALCSAGHVTDLGGVRVIGERINPTGKKRFQQALREGDMDYIAARAVEQEEAGADVLDINVGLPGIDEKETMLKVIRAVQALTDLPLMIDSSSPEVIEAALRETCGRAVVNSVNGEEKKLRSVLPLVKKYGAMAVGLCMDENGIPDSAEKRLAIGRRIVETAGEYGIPPEDILLDCLTLTAASMQAQAAETLKAVTAVRRDLHTHACLGISNISFGLPCRALITSSFLTQALYAGLDMPILNPNGQDVMDAVYCFRALSGEDKGLTAYTARFADRAVPAANALAAIAKPSSPEAAADPVAEAVLRGLGGETEALVRSMLDTMEPMEVVEKHLIPALDEVGERYDKGRLYLPQLISASAAAQKGFAAVREAIAERGGKEERKGPVVIATVEGDVHDIGKNIVKAVLENYGYAVTDLGKDVPAGTVLEAVRESGCRLLGLSALMTTTVPAMERTVRLVKENCPECRIMVGGAVLTEDYAMRIGADFYAKDAKGAADIAARVFRDPD